MFLGFRRSYLDLVVKAIKYNERNQVSLTEEPKYTDYQGKYVWNLNKNNIVSFSANGSIDSSQAERFPGGFLWIIDDEISYHTQAVLWDSFRGKYQNKLAAGYLATNQHALDGPSYEEKTATKTLFVREQLQYKASKEVHLVLGGDLYSQQRDYFETLKYGCDNPDGCTATVDDELRINRGASYLKSRWYFGENSSLDIGARLSGNDLVKKFYFEPRVGIQWGVFPRATLSAAWGQYNQTPPAQHLLGNFGNPNLEHLQSEHSVIGLGYQFTNGWSSKTEAFYKTSSDRLEWDSAKQYNINSGSGRAYGIEMMIKKELTDRLSGWLSVTGSRSKITNKLRDETFYSYYDQPLIATLVLSSKIVDSWYIDTKWYYHSGRPYTPVTSADAILNQETGEIDFFRPLQGERNSKRYPAYHRLDVRFSKQMSFSQWELETYFGLINLYNRQNVNGYNYSADYTSKSPTFQLPRFFTFGVTATF